MGDTFVLWIAGKRDTAHAHLALGAGLLALCKDWDVSTDSPGNLPRCPECVQRYAEMRDATDDLVGAFGEDGRVRR